MGNYSSKAPLANDGDGSSSSSKTVGSKRDLASSEMSHPSPVVDGGATGEGDVESVVPTVFKWEHGGRDVYITGTFNNWEKRIPMHRSGNDFSYVVRVWCCHPLFQPNRYKLMCIVFVLLPL
jgi:hypothetical protein